jgi:hypothetical protein
MFSSPFSVEFDATPTNLQLKFADFQSDSMLKEKLCDSSLTAFCSKYDISVWQYLLL